MADNRYKNNIKINQNTTPPLVLHNPNHPLNHGWEVIYHHKKLDVTVYWQNYVKLAFVTNAWIAQFPDGSTIKYEGPMDKITQDILNDVNNLNDKPIVYISNKD